MREKLLLHRPALEFNARQNWLAIIFFFCCLANSSQADSQQETQPVGIVIEEIIQSSALQKAGLEPGDLVLSWERLPNVAKAETAQGKFKSPFDWEWIKVEQASRGTLRLRGERKGILRSWIVEPGLWQAKVRPMLPADQLSEYLQGLELIKTEEFEGGAALWERLAGQERVNPLRCWFYFRLGRASEEKHAWAQARAAYRSALEATTDPTTQATVWSAIGRTFLQQSDFNQAEQQYRQAFQIHSKLAPESLSIASSLTSFGIIAQSRGWHEAARRYFQRALKIQEKLTPESLKVATNLNKLGTVVKSLGQLDTAEVYFDRSLKILQAQVRQHGGSQWTKEDLRTQYRKLYLDYITFLLARNRSIEAFSLVEHSRQGKVLELQRALDDIYWQRHKLRTKHRKESPHHSKIQEMQPLTHADTQEVLDPGTIMLSYSVAEHHTILFIVGPKRLPIVHTLPLGEEMLREEIRYFRESIDAEDFLTMHRRSAVKGIAQRLYKWLVEPAQEVIEAADRILIIPDGPLHRLPFAALIRELDDPKPANTKNWQFFIEWKPLHSALSATAYAQLKEKRRSIPQSHDEEPLLAAFGDPHYSLNHRDRAADLDISRKGITRRIPWDLCGAGLRRLPFSRREVLRIAELHRNARTHLGEEANEEGIKSLGKDVRIVHIAAHGCFDDRFPLNSALVLTLPENFLGHRDDGLLQAWEILESVHLDADLVVLSACESALSQGQGREGFLGLTSAFQYAGARTVMGTLWSVDDLVTAELMVRFYRNLRLGKPKDIALQKAQIELIQRPLEVQSENRQIQKVDASAPYFWAAFQVLGDWM